MEIKIINEKQFNELINKSKKPVLVDFFATWCMPCKMMAEVLKEAATDLGDKIEIVKVDIDISEALANKHSIESVPTMILFVNGTKAEKIMGYRQKQYLIETLKPYLK